MGKMSVRHMFPSELPVRLAEVRHAFCSSSDRPVCCLSARAVVPGSTWTARAPGMSLARPITGQATALDGGRTIALIGGSLCDGRAASDGMKLYLLHTPLLAPRADQSQPITLAGHLVVDGRWRWSTPRLQGVVPRCRTNHACVVRPTSASAAPSGAAGATQLLVYGGRQIGVSPDPSAFELWELTLRERRRRGPGDLFDRDAAEEKGRGEGGAQEEREGGTALWRPYAYGNRGLPQPPRYGHSICRVGAKLVLVGGAVLRGQGTSSVDGASAVAAPTASKLTYLNDVQVDSSRATLPSRARRTRTQPCSSQPPPRHSPRVLLAHSLTHSLSRSLALLCHVYLPLPVDATCS